MFAELTVKFKLCGLLLVGWCYEDSELSLIIKVQKIASNLNEHELFLEIHVFTCVFKIP